MLLEMRIRTLLIACMMFVLRPAIPVTEEPSHSQNQLVLKEGLNYFYNSDFMAADKKFDEYIALEPDDAVGYWRKVYNLYSEAKYEQGGTDTPKFENDKLDKFIVLIDKGIGKTDAKIRKGERVDFHLYVKSCLYSTKALVEFKNISWLDAKGSAKTAVFLAGQSQYQDAKYIVGVANYKTSERTWLIQKLSGLPGNRNEGLVLIFEAAAQNQGLFADDVWFTIWRIETDEKSGKSYDKAAIQSLFDYLFAKYPHNENLQRYLKNLNKK